MAHLFQDAARPHSEVTRRARCRMGRGVNRVAGIPWRDAKAWAEKLRSLPTQIRKQGITSISECVLGDACKFRPPFHGGHGKWGDFVSRKIDRARFTAEET